jgi:hypothetical protein
MAWSFRRRINFGAFRLNLSRSGVGYSVGTRGLRIGKDAQGRTYSAISIPRTGIYRRDYLSPPRQSLSSQAVPVANPPRQRIMPSVNLGKLMRSPWLLYPGGAALLYLLIRTVF